MRKYILSSLLLIWSAQLFAGTSTTVRLNPDIELVVTGTTNTGLTLNSIEPSGDGTSESAPAKIYVPMEGTSAGNADYFLDSGVTSLYSPSAVYPINLPLYLNTTSSDFYLYASIKDGSNGYKLAVKHGSGPFNGTTNSNTNFPFTIKAICDQLTDCSNFTTTNGTEKSYLLYIFFSTATPNSLALGTVTDPASYTGGMYFEVNMSNRIYTAAQVTPVISNIRQGDARLILEYTSNGSILKPKAVRVFKHGPSSPAGGSPIRSYDGNGSLTSTEYPFASAGQVTVSGLTNDVDYDFSVLFVDLYKFGTVVSQIKTQRPMAIQELLKKEGCFLLTAGFGEDHYVISYFRHFRDAVLAKSYLGKAFISFYYESAPKYALLIYKHETLRAMIRGMAYTLYFIFNNISLILLSSLFATLLFYLYKKREKIKI